MGVPTDIAKRFLEQKLRETIAECGVPALAAVRVSGTHAPTIISAQQGIRKVGAKGPHNIIHPHDRFNLGSISKVFTGNLIGKLIQLRVLEWTTRIVDVFPQFWIVPKVRDGYKGVTIEQLLVHTSGMPGGPAGDKAYDWLKYTPLQMTKPHLRQRRQGYVVAALLDPPKYWPPGSGREYSGGGIIAAAMAEQVTDRTYEDLMQTHIYGPLRMTNSGFGELSRGPLDGPWQHRWDGKTRKLKPDPDTKRDGYSWNPRNPVGGACCSAHDLGKFIREQLRVDPQVFNGATRTTMQTHQVTTASKYVRGAWMSSKPGSDQANISHNGDNGVSYANMIISLSKKVGFAAMSNANKHFGAPAVNEMIEVMRMMHKHWTALFAAAGVEFLECAHPVPAVTLAGQKMLVFARRHDGKVLRYRSLDGGSTWQAAGDFGSAVFTSGLAATDAASDGRQVYFCGRGTDNQIWFTSSADGGDNWKEFKAIGGGTYLTGPAVAASGTTVNAFAVGMDNKMYHIRSVNSGENWNDWKPIGEGRFTSAPAATASRSSPVVHVFGRGEDWRMWHNVSSNHGATWKPHWDGIGKGVFTSGPGAAASSNGATVHVMARGTDRKLWRNMTSNTGEDWLPRWKSVPLSTYTSAPSLAASDDGQTIYIFAFGKGFRIHKNQSLNRGRDWMEEKRVGAEWFL